MTKQEFKELVAKGKVVLDGATGSNLMKAGMPRGVCSEAWIYENPQLITSGLYCILDIIEPSNYNQTIDGVSAIAQQLVKRET